MLTQIRFSHMSRKRQQFQGKFFDLSAEIFEQITSYLGLGSHFRLCFLSHQVHRYLLPSYLRRCGLEHSDDLTTLDTIKLDADDAVEIAFRVVRASPLITTLRHLHCTFNVPQYQLLREFHIVKNTLTKLRRVEKVTLDFSLVREALSRGGPTFSPAVEWRDAFAKLMRIIVMKSPSDLKIIGRAHSLWFTSIRRLQLQDGMLHTFTRQGHRCKRLAAALFSSLSSPSTSTPLTQIIGFVDLGSITSLTIESCEIASHEWELLGPYLILSGLTTLKLNLDSQCSFDSLVLFLGRHPMITTLHLDGLSVWPSQPCKSLAPAFLPKLKSLHAPLTVFFIFYDEDNIGASAHALTDMEISLRVLTSSYWNDAPGWRRILPKRLQGIPGSLRLNIQTQTPSWMTDPPYAPISSPSIIGLTLDISEEFTGQQWELLPGWLSQFPDLQWFCVRHAKQALRSHTVAHEDNFVRSALVEGLGQAPRLREITIDGRSYTLGDAET